MRNRNLQNYIGHMYYRIFNIFTLPAACKNHPEPVSRNASVTGWPVATCYWNQGITILIFSYIS
jgi:hypothetical protein